MTWPQPRDWFLLLFLWCTCGPMGVLTAQQAKEMGSVVLGVVAVGLGFGALVSFCLMTIAVNKEAA